MSNEQIKNVDSFLSNLGWHFAGYNGDVIRVYYDAKGNALYHNPHESTIKLFLNDVDQIVDVEIENNTINESLTVLFV